jgi:HD-GYP domain-containing protein (c-di-GMP phosphodiesterase class II)
MNTKEKREYTNGKTPMSEFNTAVDSRLAKNQSDNKIPNVLVLEFNIKDEAFAGQKNTFSEIISKTISDNINPNEDLYTFDEKNFFLIFFSAERVNAAVLKASDIVSEIKQGLKGYIEINIGLSQYPKHGQNCNDLVKHAALLIARSKQQIRKKPFLGNASLEEIQQRIERFDEPTNTGRLIRQLTSLISYINNYDKYLSEHSCLVAAGSILFAKELDLPWQEIEKISIAAILHDVGYTVFPNTLLQKQGKLTSDEWRIIKLHPLIACEQILRPLEVFDKYLPIIQNHHEFIDGSGYPKGKRGDAIPLGAQIISIIDAYQSMRVDRPYRKAFAFNEIVDVYVKNADIKWDRELITIFLAIIGDPSISKNLAGKNIDYEIIPFKDPI